MTATATKPRSKRKFPARDVEAEVTQRIIDSLEAGVVPWQQPWRSSGLLPTSVSTGRPYRGANLLFLALDAMTKGYTSPYWMTYRQAAERKGNVKAGEKGSLVVFWKRWSVKDATPEDPDKMKSVFLLRHYTVFNLEQTENVELPPRFRVDVDDLVAPDPLAAAEDIWDGYEDGPELRYGGGRAYYTPTTDEITLPERRFFETTEGFYSTLFHEAVHSTGHKSRLERPGIDGFSHFGSEKYAKEELVAEVGAAILLSLAGVEPRIEQNAAYIASWLTALREDKSLIVKAAQQAQKAADRITGWKPNETEEE